MRGVILSQCDARIVDITHQFPRQDIRTAAFWLREILPWFPPAVHCVVVDPGVGTDRRAVAVRVGEHCLVGPDNGVLMPAVRTLEGKSQAFEIDLGTPESSTFHGRDVFAPAAARIHETSPDCLSEQPFLTPCTGLTTVEFPTPTYNGDRIIGEILVVDEFGNAITNIPGGAVETDQLQVNGESVPFVASFAYVSSGEPLVTVGSHGNLELAVNQGRGEAAFEVSPGSEVIVQPA